MKQQTQSFYLPNLCDVHALLPLIMTGELLALAFCLVQQPLPTFDWPLFALLSVEMLWIVLLGAGLLCHLSPHLKRLSASIGATLCYLVLLLVTALVSSVGQVLLRLLDNTVAFNYHAVLQQLAVSAIIIGMVLRYFYLQQQLNTQQKMRLRAEMEARFQALQSRIRPHFLFNSMNIIASLIASDPDTAEQAVEDLSVLFRASLSDAQDIVPLAKELGLCEHYIHIEQLRLGERLTVRWHKNIRDEQHAVPLLCLQPLLENAIYHGIQPLLAGGVIDIRINDDHGRLTLCVDNPCAPPDVRLSHHHSNGMALANLEQRLQARYGQTATFSITQTSTFFRVVFSLPINHDNQGKKPPTTTNSERKTDADIDC